MSRPFWTAIGAIAGFFVGGSLGLAAAHRLYECCYGETMLPAFGSVIGVLLGAIGGWCLAPRLPQKP